MARQWGKALNTYCANEFDRDNNNFRAWKESKSKNSITKIKQTSLTWPILKLAAVLAGAAYIFYLYHT